jgi:hypothetical protein
MTPCGDARSGNCCEGMFACSLPDIALYVHTHSADEGGFDLADDSAGSRGSKASLVTVRCSDGADSKVN